LARNTIQPARLAPVGDRPGDPAVVGEQPHHRALHEHVDAQGHGPVLEGPDHLQAGAVADVGQAGEAVAAEVALEDAAVVGAVEQRPPLLQLVDPVGGLLGVELGHPPAVEHLAAAHGVAEVHPPVVVGVDVAHGGGDAALGHDRVRLAQQGLADQGGPGPPVVGLDGGPQAGPAGPDDDDVEVVGLVLGHGLEQPPRVADGAGRDQSDVHGRRGPR
jgi:hypothetical protein